MYTLVIGKRIGVRLSPPIHVVEGGDVKLPGVLDLTGYEASPPADEVGAPEVQRWADFNTAFIIAEHRIREGAPWVRIYTVDTEMVIRARSPNDKYDAMAA
jgi:hypothetical protein